MYYGTKGMGSMPQAIQQKSDTDLQPAARRMGRPFQWRAYRTLPKRIWKMEIQAQGETLGIFDRLIVAHNGKCADRIMSKTPAKGVHNLRRVNFAPRVPPRGDSAWL